MAALLLDERFGLKERATTALTLPAEVQSTPAAQALLTDVNQRVGQLHVSSRFPVWPSWKAALVPAGALGLALLAFFYPASSGAKPLLGTNHPTSPQDSAKPPANLEEIKQSFDKLKTRPREQSADKPLADELKRFEAEENRIAARPHDTQEDLRERIKEMNTLQEPMANREKELAEKIQARQQQLQQLNRQAKEEKEQEGPAKDLQKDLAQNKLDKASQEAKQLAQKLQDQKQGLNKQEQVQLAKQLENMQQQLDRLANLKDQEERFRKLNQEGKLNDQALQQELKQLKADQKKLKELQDLANKMGQIQTSLKKGDQKEAAKDLQKAADQLQAMQGQEQAQKELAKQLQQLQDAKEASLQGINGNPSRSGQPGNQATPDGRSGPRAGGRSRQPGPPGSQATPGSGARPESDNTVISSVDVKAPSNLNDKGQIYQSGYAPGQNFQKKTSAEIAGEIQQASQEGAEAIEYQRIPRADRDIAKGYFRNLGSQKK